MIDFLKDVRFLFPVCEHEFTSSPDLSPYSMQNLTELSVALFFSSCCPLFQYNMWICATQYYAEIYLLRLTAQDAPPDMPASLP